MEAESGVTESITDEHHSPDIQRDQMEGESGAIQSVIDEFLSSDIQPDEMGVKVVLLEASLMKLILGISKDME